MIFLTILVILFLALIQCLIRKKVTVAVRSTPGAANVVPLLLVDNLFKGSIHKFPTSFPNRGSAGLSDGRVEYVWVLSVTMSVGTSRMFTLTSYVHISEIKGIVMADQNVFSFNETYFKY